MVLVAVVEVQVVVVPEIPHQLHPAKEGMAVTRQLPILIQAMGLGAAAAVVVVLGQLVVLAQMVVVEPVVLELHHRFQDHR